MIPFQMIWRAYVEMYFQNGILHEKTCRTHNLLYVV